MVEGFDPLDEAKPMECRGALGPARPRVLLLSDCAARASGIAPETSKLRANAPSNVSAGFDALNAGSVVTFGECATIFLRGDPGRARRGRARAISAGDGVRAARV
jgi:hypothetical protein